MLSLMQVEHELQEDAGTCYALSDALREIGCAIQVCYWIQREFCLMQGPGSAEVI